MAVIGIAVITIVMACAAAGAIASLIDDEHGLGKEFLEGLRAIGFIFIPVAGIMASRPYLARFVESLVGQTFHAIGADPAMAATSIIAVDMGGYFLAHSLRLSTESWMMAMLTGTMAGATIVFSIPVGLGLLDKRDHKYMALGVMAGLLAIPVGVFIGSVLMMALSPEVRTFIGKGPPDYVLALTWSTILLNLAPLAIFVGVLAIALRLAPGAMVRGFMAFGRILNVLIILIVVASIIEYYTNQFYGRGLFTRIFGGWGFDPLIADADQVGDALKAGETFRDEWLMRALEVAGYIGLMLSGAFPMVYLINRYLSGPMQRLGRLLGLSAAGAAGLLAAAANILAMFRLIRDMPPRDKVLCIAFGVCSAFLLGDHLAFTANVQPNMLVPVMGGKFAGGVCGVALALWLSVPKALELEKQEMLDEAQALAAELPAFQGKELTVAALGGGLTNRNYRVDAGGDTFVLRIAGAGTELLGIDREREVACAHAAAGAGVGPEVVAHVPERHLLVTRFVKGRQLTADDARHPDMLRRLAKTLRRCHDYPAPPDLGTFSPFAVIRSYHHLSINRGVEFPADFSRSLEILSRIEAELKTDAPRCLCHNDLLSANFLDDGSRIRIIDWEYGGLGDRFFDLGNFAVNHQLDAAGEDALLEAYFGAARPEDRRRLQLMRLVSDLRESAWGYLQSALSALKPEEPYPAYGRRHLDRFLAGARTMGLQP